MQNLKVSNTIESSNDTTQAVINTVSSASFSSVSNSPHCEEISVVRMVNDTLSLSTFSSNFCTFCSAVTSSSPELLIHKCKGCSKESQSRLSCPTCQKLKLAVSYFCCQECFKTNWKEHKTLHKIAMNNAVENTDKEAKEEKKNKTLDALLNIKQKLQPEFFDPYDKSLWQFDSHLSKFVGYKFSGKIRPWPISGRRKIPSDIKMPDYGKSGYPLSEIKQKKFNAIIVNTPEDIQKIRETCLLGRKALDLAHSLIRVGITTDEIDKHVHNFIVENNAYPSPLNYYQFPKSCCTSVNEVICHGIPDYRKLEEGDIVNVDITVYINGMHGDLNETFCVGKFLDDETKNLVQTAYDALQAAIKHCKVGMMYREIGNIISSVAEKRGLSVVRTYCGHGVGKHFHSYPNIPHYKKNKAVGVMKAGHVFTIEPMINLGTWKDTTWPDSWTAVTLDGKKSAQFEHTILLTENGAEVLTARLASSPPLEIDE